MAYVNDSVFDNGLNWAVTEGVRLDICSADPTNSYTGATSLYSLGSTSNTPVSVSSPAPNSPDGRKVVIEPISDGEVTATGTASHWALTDGQSVVIASGSLTSAVAVTQGSTFTLTGIDIAIRDAI